MTDNYNYDHPNNYAMYTKEGNDCVAAFVESAKDWIKRFDPQKVEDLIYKEMRKIAAKHGEVHDTAVREMIVDELQKASGDEYQDWGLF